MPVHRQTIFLCVILHDSRIPIQLSAVKGSPSMLKRKLFVCSVFRESALLAAVPPPCLTRGSYKKVKYPFVFDAYSEAQQSSAYVSGNKVTDFSV